MRKFIGMAIASALAFTGSAMAAVDTTGVTLDTAAVEGLAVKILGALAIIWVARKVVGFLRS